MSLKKRLLTGAAIAVVAVLVAVAWFLGLFTPEPEEVSLAETVAAVEQSAAADSVEPAPTEPQAPEPSATAEPLATPTAVPSTSLVEIPSGDTPLAGAWQVEPGDVTFVGYRADSPTGEAVGRTRGVEGSLVASDTSILAVDITADLASLASDSRFRDEHLGTEGLETRTYPTSRFVLTQPITVDIAPEDGATGGFTAVGELTVKEVTMPVSISLEGTLVGDQLVVVGSTELDLVDYDATISGIEEAVMEFSLVFVPTG